jgi:hypothetical protein
MLAGINKIIMDIPYVCNLVIEDKPSKLSYHIIILHPLAIIIYIIIPLECSFTKRTLAFIYSYCDQPFWCFQLVMTLPVVCTVRYCCKLTTNYSFKAYQTSAANLVELHVSSHLHIMLQRELN